MARPAKIIGAARRIVAKYGKAGPNMARRRARQASQRSDEAAASAWEGIAFAADGMLTPQGDGRASLSDVLEAGVTEQMRQMKKRRDTEE